MNDHIDLWRIQNSKHLYLCVLHIFLHHFNPHVMTQIVDCELLNHACTKALTR